MRDALTDIMSNKKIVMDLDGSNPQECLEEPTIGRERRQIVAHNSRAYVEFIDDLKEQREIIEKVNSGFYRKQAAKFYKR